MEQEVKTTPNTNRALSTYGIILAAIIVIGLLIAGLLKWIAWPVVSYILKATLITTLIGMVGASLLEARRKTKNRPLKALLILTTIVGIVIFVGALQVLDYAKPEMRPIENLIFKMLFLAAGFAGLSIFELKAYLTGQTYEPPEDSWAEKMLKKTFKPVLEKLTTMNNLLLIGAAVFMLLLALIIHMSDSDISNPYLLLTLEIAGLGGIVFGIATWIEARSPRFAKGLSFLGNILVILLLYFIIRSFIYE